VPIYVYEVVMEDGSEGETIEVLQQMTACGLEHSVHARQPLDEAWTEQSARWLATWHRLSLVKLGQWIMLPPPQLHHQIHQSHQAVLAELSGSVSEGLEHFCQSRRFRLQSKRFARPTNGGHAAADGILPSDECSASSSTGRLGVMVREHDALSGDAVDVRRPIAHRTVAIGADILPPHIIWKNDEDVRLLVMRLSGRQREDSKAECDENNLAIHMGWFISIRPVLRGSCR